MASMHPVIKDFPSEHEARRLLTGLAAWKSRMTRSELRTYIFDGKTNELADQVDAWMAASRRFHGFVLTYRDKIRKKLRNAPDAESRSSISQELETAFLLLQDRRFTVEYEKQGTGKTRDPDFCVTFRDNLTFHLEVTCVHVSGSELDFPVDKLISIICDKIGQARPGGINILLVAVGSICIESIAVASAMKDVKDRAECREESLYARCGCNTPADFFKRYQRLSALLIRGTGQAALWINPQARYPIPEQIRSVLQSWA